MNIELPLDDTWTSQEIIDVTMFYDLILTANEQGVDRQRLLSAYQVFQMIVPTKGQQKQLDRQLQRQTGVSLYRTMQAAMASQRKHFKFSD
ncbi:UPF0223 protein [Furfurilactobacillus curtus]|uniref:UPF0223 protein n=2 Tax=Furfurilactobacillus curtus TaxID=1746200 RepID=A0ABQ5JL84_9LACO